MNTIEYLSDSEYNKLVANCDFTHDELFVVQHMRRNDLTCDGIAMELGVSYHKFKIIKANALLKIFKQATK